MSPSHSRATTAASWTWPTDLLTQNAPSPAEGAFCVPDPQDSALPAWQSGPVRDGELQVTALTDGTFIPRPRYFGPDAVSHPRSDVFDRAGAAWLPIGSFLVRTGGRTILVDAGLGPDLQQLPDDMYLVGGQLMTGLRAAGVDRQEITDVVCTHLHADHVGWLFDEDAEPVFPAASIWFGAGDWHHFVDGPGEMAPHIERGLRSSTQLKLLDQDTTVARGVDAIMTPGHTPGTCPWPSTGAPSASCCSATPSPAR